MNIINSKNDSKNDSKYRNIEKYDSDIITEIIKTDAYKKALEQIESTEPVQPTEYVQYVDTAPIFSNGKPSTIVATELVHPDVVEGLLYKALSDKEWIEVILAAKAKAAEAGEAMTSTRDAVKAIEPYLTYPDGTPFGCYYVIYELVQNKETNEYSIGTRKNPVHKNVIEYYLHAIKRLEAKAKEDGTTFTQELEKENTYPLTYDQLSIRRLRFKRY